MEYKAKTRLGEHILCSYQAKILTKVLWELSEFHLEHLEALSQNPLEEMKQSSISNICLHGSKF